MGNFWGEHKCGQSADGTLKSTVSEEWTDRNQKLIKSFLDEHGQKSSLHIITGYRTLLGKNSSYVRRRLLHSKRSCPAWSEKIFLKVTHFLTLRRFYTNILLFFCPACDSFSSKNMLLHRTKNLNINHSWLDKLGEYSIGCWWTYAHLSLIIIKVQYLQIFLRDAQTPDVLIFFKKNFVWCSIWNSPCPT